MNSPPCCSVQDPFQPHVDVSTAWDAFFLETVFSSGAQDTTLSTLCYFSDFTEIIIPSVNLSPIKFWNDGPFQAWVKASSLLTLILHFLLNLSNSKYFKWHLLMWMSISVPQLQTCNQFSAWLSWLHTQRIHDSVNDLLHTTHHPGQRTPCSPPHLPFFLYLPIWVSTSFSLHPGHHVLLNMPPE